MAKPAKKTVKTKVGDLKYVFIKGEGRNQAMPGEPDHFMYVASIVTKKNSPLHKDLKSQIDECWKEYQELNGIKGGPAKNKNGEPMIGIKTIMVDSETEKDEYDAPLKVATDDVIITFKTNTVWPKDNKPVKVKVLDGKGKDLTEAFQKVDWSIGEGSTGILHGMAMANDVGGSHKVSLYLSAVQLAKLVKYEGASIDAEEIDDADEIDMGIPAIDDDDSEESGVEV